MLFFGKIENKKLKLSSEKKFKDFIADQKDGTYEITVKKWRKKRSLDQNALYWVWLQIIAKELGYDTEELHSSFKSMFLTDRSKKIPLVRSTTVLNTLEFINYLKAVERQASELGITLPRPENHF